MNEIFDKQDVLKVAKALSACENFSHYDNYSDRWECIYCDKDALASHEIKHSLDCPVLVARDLLTGFDND